MEISTSWHPYPKIFAIGQSIISNLFLDPVIVEEKIDGSQISFGSFDGELRIKSKTIMINPLEPEKLFAEGVEVIKKLHEANLLVNNFTYRCEYLKKPKHNTLAYDRIPPNHLIGFDINIGHEVYLPYADKVSYFNKLGLTTVPILYHGWIKNFEDFIHLLDSTSCLGGQKIEGVVVKNYFRFNAEGKALLGKYVSESFKELNHNTFKKENPGGKDFIALLIEKYKTPARWAKAWHHLRESGAELSDSPKDIPLIMKEIGEDVQKECEQDIKEELFNYAWPKILRGIKVGFPEWFKQQLVKKVFTEGDSSGVS